MDKKGDLPVTLLIIGVFAVCTLALLSFLYSSYQMHKSFVGVEIVEKANLQIEAQNLEHLYLDKKVNKFSPEWGFDWFKEKIVFSVEYNR
jgi:N-acetylglutamate synthase-like GNAT family acetyltransferase